MYKWLSNTNYSHCEVITDQYLFFFILIFQLDVVINDRDLIIETKRATGAGGQHVNTTDSAVRMRHKPTGYHLYT